MDETKETVTMEKDAAPAQDGPANDAPVIENTAPSPDAAPPVSDATTPAVSAPATDEGASSSGMTLAEPSQAHTTASVEQSKTHLALLKDIGLNSVYLMGTSFILGVLFTVFVLLVLDFMRRNAEDNGQPK